MVENRTEMSTFSMLYQVGVVVRDLQKAVDYYQSLGIGPFQPLVRPPIEREVYGKPAPDVKLDIRVANLGPLGFELVQPVAGKSIQKEFLDRKGEGVNHFGFLVDDVEAEVKRMSKKGIQVISSGKYAAAGDKHPPGLMFAYFDVSQSGSISFEVVKKSPQRILSPPAKKEKTTFSRPYQVALVVKDMERAVKQYQSLGIGPFSGDTGKVCKERVINGRPAPDVRLDVREAYLGPWSFELMQPAVDPKKESIQSEILNTKGEGFIHICFLVDDIQKDLVQLAKKGIKVISSGKYPDATGKYPGGPSFSHLDTRQVGGVILELAQAREDRMQKWEARFPGW